MSSGGYQPAGRLPGKCAACGYPVSAASSSRVSFPAVLERLHREKHTGPVTIHFAQGSPNAVEIPSTPVKIKIDKGARGAQD